MRPDYHEYYAEGHFTREQVCRVAWHDRDAFLEAIMPDVQIDKSITVETMQIGLFGGTVGQGQLAAVDRYFLKRLDPEPYPGNNSNPQNLYAVDYEVLEAAGYPKKMPDGTFGAGSWSLDSTGNQQGNAFIKVTWKTLPYRLDISDPATNQATVSELARYCTIKTSYAGQNLELIGSPLRKMRFDGTPATNPPSPFPFTIRRPFPESHIQITWWMVPVIPQCIPVYEGRVNSTTITFPESGNRLFRASYRPGTMLFLTAEVSEPYYTFGGTRVVNLTYHFLRRDNQAGPRNFGIGHNFLFSGGDRQFYRAAFPNFVAGNYVGPTNDNPWPPNQNIHDYVEMNNLWKIDADSITYS